MSNEDEAVPLTFALFILMALLWQQSAPAAVPVFAVSGTVVDSASGARISLADIGLTPQFSGPDAQSTTTDSAGHFVFTGVAAGRYTLTAKRRGFATQSYLQHGQFFSAVVVGAELDTSNLTFALEPEGAITGQVYDSFGDPVRRAQVQLFSRTTVTSAANPTVHVVQMTDDQGRYRFGRLLPGVYFVEVTAQPWYARHPGIAQEFASSQESGPANPQLDVSYPVTFFGNAPDLASAQPIDLAAGDTETADITLTAAPSRHLIVHLPLTPGQFPVFIVRGGPSGPTASRPANANPIGPGVWDIADILPGATILTLYTYDPQGGLPRHVQTIALGDQTELNLSAPSSGAHIKGVMFGEAGFKSAGSHIALTGPPGNPLATAEVSADGSFEFDSPLDPGEYSLTVNADSPHFLTHLTATGAKVSGRRVEIASTDVQLSVTVSAANAQVSGFAVRDGKHLAGMLIALLPETPGRDVVPVRFDQSDGDGSFRFQNVVPGQYKLVALDGAWSAPDWNSEAFAKKFAPQGKSVSVMANGEAKIDLPVLDVSKASPVAPSAPQHNPR